jgi:dTDP-N-acetylfucosamine:lipid II N-acetylfucosaminyltransferase
MNNLHLMLDSNFTRDFIEVMESMKLFDIHKYLIYNVNNPSELKFVDSNKVIVARYNTKEFHNAIGDIKSYKRIFIHFLSVEMCKFLNKLPALDNIYWIFWGADFYSPPSCFFDFLYDKHTQEYMKKYMFNRGQAVNIPSSILNNFVSKKILLLRDKKLYNIKAKAISKVSYFLHFNKYDYDIVKSFFKTDMKFLPFRYGHVEFNDSDILFPEIMNDLKNKYSPSSYKIIFVGNSGDPTNNHLDLFYLLKNLNIKEKFKIICPLSYGNKKYIDFIIKKGKEFFGDDFIAITQYLDKNIYNNLIACSDIMIMYHNRTQGVGNINIALHAGKKVFLKKENTTYKLYKDLDLKIFNTEHDLMNNDIFDELTDEDKANNKKIIKDVFLAETQKENLYFILSNH